MSTNYLDLLNSKKKSIDGFNLNGSVCTKLLQLISLSSWYYDLAFCPWIAIGIFLLSIVPSCKILELSVQSVSCLQLFPTFWQNDLGLWPPILKKKIRKKYCTIRNKLFTLHYTCRSAALRNLTKFKIYPFVPLFKIFWISKFLI